MPRTTRIRRPPNREPTSLAATTATSENEAIDTIEALVPDPNIDLALGTYEINYPLPPSYELDSLDPDYESYDLSNF